MRANLEKLYYILNKSQSRIIVEVDLTTASFAKRQIEFKHGDIRQFLVLSDNIYSINCRGILQIFNFKSSSFKEATITSSGTSCLTLDSMIVDNFTVSSDEKFIAITGCEMKKNNVYKNVIHVYQVNKMKKISSTVLKVQGTQGGAIKKMSLIYSKQGIPLLVVVTDGNCALYVYELRDRDLRFLCMKEKIHESRICLNKRVHLRSRLQGRLFVHLF